MFNNDETPIVVSAQEVFDGKYSRYNQFVDVKYPEYRVEYVSGGKPKKGETKGCPYFRWYYSYEQYKERYPDGAERYYEIVGNQRHFQESKWHQEWKEKLSSFCENEKRFVNKDKKWKYADAYNAKTDTCIELQHSYASNEFKDRNEFYAEEGKTMIWLFHLPNAQVKETADGNYEILEDNARGFFRAAYESQYDFGKIIVFVQVQSGQIYRISKLHRKEGAHEEIKSTTWCFFHEGVWNEEGWIKWLRYGGNNSFNTESYLLYKLWDNDYKYMQLYNSLTGDKIYIYHDRDKDELLRTKYSCIMYTSILDSGQYTYMTKADERMRQWEPIRARLRTTKKEIVFGADKQNNLDRNDLFTIDELWKDDYDYLELRKNGDEDTIFIYQRIDGLLRSNSSYPSIMFNHSLDEESHTWMKAQDEYAWIWKPIYAETKNGERVDF